MEAREQFASCTTNQQEDDQYLNRKREVGGKDDIHRKDSDL